MKLFKLSKNIFKSFLRYNVKHRIWLNWKQNCFTKTILILLQTTLWSEYETNLPGKQGIEGIRNKTPIN